MFNMKKLWKKMCVLGVSAVTALSFSSPFVKAVDPNTYQDQSRVGVLVGTTTIGGNLIPYVICSLNNKNPSTVSFDGTGGVSANLDYNNGTAWQLINSISNVRVNVGNGTKDLYWLDGTGTSATKVNLYLRVDTVGNTSPGDWVHIKNANDLENVNLKKSEVGQYQIRYYIDHLDTPYSDAGLPSGSVK